MRSGIGFFLSNANMKRFDRKEKCDDSHLWKCILEARNIILKGSLAFCLVESQLTFGVNLGFLGWNLWTLRTDGQTSKKEDTTRTIADLSTGNAWNKEVVLQFLE
uniref:Uncharacterized protein n=1 Tax=Cannabis sativa TaxID=3483 RepID=A0A803QRS3_CANSA